MILLQFLPILYFLILNTLTVKVSRKQFGISMPVTLMLCTFVMYCSQLLLNSFIPAYVLLLAAGLVAVVAFIISIRKEEFRRLYFSAGFICVLGIAVLIAFSDWGKHYSVWDEFSHWGKMVKEMIRLDSFYSVSDSNLLVHKDYPPFAGLFEVLWCKLSVGYSEASVNRAIHFLEISLIAPFLSEKIAADSKVIKRLLCSACMIAICVLLMLSFDGETVFRTIYPDFLVPALFVYAMFLVLDTDIDSRCFKTCGIIIALGSMSLTKQVSLAFILLTWFFYTIYSVAKDNRAMGYRLLSSLMVLAGPLLIMRTWSFYTRKLGLSGQFDFSKISVSSLVDILMGRGTDVQIQTRNLYLNALLKEPLNTGLVKLSYLAIVMIIAAIIVFLLWAYRTQFEKLLCIKLLVTLIGGAVAYAFMMFVLYMFCFSEYEMLALNSYGRYMDCYIVSVLLIILYVISMLNSKGIQYGGILPVLILAVFVMDFGRISDLLPERLTGINKPENNTYAVYGDYLNVKTKPYDRILLISADNCKRTYYLNYYLDEGRVFDERYLYTDVASISSENADFWNEYIDYAKAFGYIFIYETSPDIEAVLGKYVSDGNIEAMSLFEINNVEDRLSLARVN